MVGSGGGVRITLETARTRPGLLKGAVLSEPPVFSMTSGPPAGPAIAQTVQQAAAGSGHVTYAEAPDEFVRAVAAFACELASPVPAR